MTRRSKKLKRLDTPKLIIILLLGIIITANIVVNWNSSDLLNSLSTTITSIFWLVAMPLAFIGFVIFYITVLIDAAKKSKILWFILILLLPGFGLLYFVFEKPEIVLNNMNSILWATAVLICFFGSVTTYPLLIGHLFPPENDKPVVSFSGKVVEVHTFDYSGGPGEYKILADGGSVTTVNVGPHPPCDQHAAKVTLLKPGDAVIVQAVQNEANYYSVCDNATFLKKT